MPTPLTRDALQAQLFDELPGGIVISDNATRVLYANGEFRRSMGFSGADLATMRLYDRVHPDDQPSVRRYADLLKTERRMTTTRRFRKGDGTYVILERSVQLLDDGTQLSVCREVPQEEDLGRRYRLSLAGMRAFADALAALESPDRASLSAIVSRIQEEIDRQTRLIAHLPDSARAALSGSGEENPPIK